VDSLERTYKMPSDREELIVMGFTRCRWFLLPVEGSTAGFRNTTLYWKTNDG